ncbi:MAG: hypothetical protein V4506_10510 [Bacteroidota bacterium]
MMSCDKYDDLWDPFFYFFEKHWSDCPYPVYLATNTKVYSRKQSTTINSNYFGTWSEETKIVLEKLPYEYIIYLQDDYFILQKVDNLILSNLISKVKDYNADYLRLFPSPGPDSDFKGDPDIGLISVNAGYRTSLQAAIWKREVLVSVLNAAESPWEFETNSPERTKSFLFLSVKQQVKGHIKTHTYPITYYYLTAVLRGKWRWEIKEICKKEGIALDFNYRKAETYKEFLYQRFYDQCPVFIKRAMDFLKNKLKIKSA